METKFCNSCSTEKHIEDFSWKYKHKNIRQHQCKDCHKKYKQDYYLKNSSRVIEDSKSRHHERSARFREYKKNLACVMCGENTPECLDFHHMDPSSKMFNVGIKAPQLGWETLEKEIKKCIVLCKNCHVKAHIGVLDLKRIELFC